MVVLNCFQILFINVRFGNTENKNYLKPTEACQTKANKRNNTGIMGKTSTSGLKIANIPGNFANTNIYINQSVKLFIT